MATNIEIKNAKPKEKDYTINVNAGLSLLVKATGSKLWRFRYSFSKKRGMVSLGKYPQISMKQAKAKQREFMDMLEQGINPSAHKQTQKIKLATERPFREFALDWHAKHYQHSNDRHNKLVSHGFRGMASTILNENKFRGDVVEKQLAHQERNKVRGAYNRAEYLEERTEMMQWYADYLDKLKNQNS